MNTLPEINFVPHHALSPKKITFIGAALALLALVVMSYFFKQYEHAQYTLTQTQATLASLAPQHKPVAVKTVLETASEPELKLAKTIVAQLSTPWNPLLNTIEQSNMQNIALLSIEPSRKKQQLLLTGQAKNIASAVQYIKQLETTDSLSQVYLLKHSIDQNDPYKPVGFTIMAKWQP